MGLKINRLTARRVATVTDPGYHPDGGELCLQVTASGAKSWVFRYRFEGRRPEMGLGPLHVIRLTDAHAAADATRRMVQAGQDPLAGRRAAGPIRSMNAEVTCLNRSAKKSLIPASATLRNRQFARIMPRPRASGIRSGHVRPIRPAPRCRLWPARTCRAKFLRCQPVLVKRVPLQSYGSIWPI
ncbi:hypothetical protein D3C71_1151080 [compost metagenome]